MKDLTNGAVIPTLLSMALPIAFGMLMGAASQVISIYVVSDLGPEAVAGVGIASNVIFIVVALMQILSSGTIALIAQAVGSKSATDANLTFNQALALATFSGVIVWAGTYAGMRTYLQLMSADGATIKAGTAFMSWTLPGYALLFPAAVIVAALRGTGVAWPPVLINGFTVILHAALALVLVSDWGVALGVEGAGIAVSLSNAIGLVLLGIYVCSKQRLLFVRGALMLPQRTQWRRLLRIGMPVGIEYVLLFLSTAVVYYAIREFGAEAQAGFGIGSQVTQLLLLPAMAIAFATSPVAAQHLGARNLQRIRETFRASLLIGAPIMGAITIVLQSQSQIFVNMFEGDASTLAAAAVLLQLQSWGFVAQACVYTCQSMLQGLGNTMPSMWSSMTRFAVFSTAAIWLSSQREFHIEQLWYLWTASLAIQAALSLWMLHLEFKRQLPQLSTTAHISN